MEHRQFVQSKEAGLSIIDPSKNFVEHIIGYDYKSIIDFGCGFGCHVNLFNDNGKDAYRVDINFTEDAKEDAKKKGYTLFEGSWNSIQDQKFDAGFSHHCLEHARDPILWLHEWGKLIKTGGYLFLVVPKYLDILLAGHIAVGWNKGTTAYNLAVAGWDCTDGKFDEDEKNIYAIVRKPENFVIEDTHIFGFGDRILARMPKTLELLPSGTQLVGEYQSIF